MHTQYNLILSAAIVSRITQDENTLVLYSEFSVSDQMRKSLSKIFDRVIIVQENYTRRKKPIAEAKQTRAYLKMLKPIEGIIFDTIYMY